MKKIHQYNHKKDEIKEEGLLAIISKLYHKNAKSVAKKSVAKVLQSVAFMLHKLTNG